VTKDGNTLEEGGNCRMPQVSPAASGTPFDYKPPFSPLFRVARHITWKAKVLGSQQWTHIPHVARVRLHVSLEDESDKPGGLIRDSPRLVRVRVPRFCFIGALIKGSPRTELKNNASTRVRRARMRDRAAATLRSSR